MADEQTGTPEQFGLESRNPGTRVVLERTFAQLASRFDENTPAGQVNSDELAGLASIMLGDAALGGNLEAQMTKAALKAREILVVLPRHSKTLNARKLCWRYILRGWELTSDLRVEADLADAILRLAIPDFGIAALHDTLEESLKTLRGEPARTRIKRLLDRANADSNLLVIEVMFKRLVDVSALPDILALAHAVAAVK